MLFIQEFSTANSTPNLRDVSLTMTTLVDNGVHHNLG